MRAIICCLKQSLHLLQVSLGGLSTFHDLKNACRAAGDLSALTEDTHAVCREMRASSPPASAQDLIEQQQQQPRRGNMRAGGQAFKKVGNHYTE